MQFTATHHFPHPFDQVAARFLDPAAHVSRYELAGHHAITILGQEVRPGSLRLQLVRTVEGEVPALAQKIIKATNTVTTTDRWTQEGPSSMLGTVRIEASAVPGTATIHATVGPADDGGTTYDVLLELSLKVPLLGERFVTLLRPQVMEIIDTEFEAWDRQLGLAAQP